jgi:hypothetical protein
MMEPTRQEHLEWCKKRAFEELDNPRVEDPGQRSLNAINSFISDLDKHPATQGHIGIELTGMLLFTGNLHMDDTEAVRKHIDGFN